MRIRPPTNTRMTNGSPPPRMALFTRSTKTFFYLYEDRRPLDWYSPGFRGLSHNLLFFFEFMKIMHIRTAVEPIHKQWPVVKSGWTWLAANWLVPASPSAQPVEVTLLRDVRGVPGSQVVGGGGRGGIAGHVEQVTADRVEPVVTGEGAGEFVGRGQPGRRAGDHGEGDQRARGHPGEQLVEREDLCPVGIRDGGGLVVHGGDRGLELVGAERARRGKRPRDKRGAVRDERLVPAGTVLLRQWDERAVRCDASGAPGVGEQHEREQAGG